MRPYIIVTVENNTKTFSLDLEVPTDLPAKRLVKDMAEVLNSYFNQRRVLGTDLFCQRLNRSLWPDESFADAGVWPGDKFLIA